MAKVLNGFLKFEVARRVLGHRHALVDLKDLPTYVEITDYYDNEAVRDAYYKHYETYARLVRRAYYASLRGYCEISDHSAVMAQTPTVELVHGRLVYEHVVRYDLPANASFRDGNYRLTGTLSGEMGLVSDPNLPGIRASSAIGASLLVLMGHVPYNAGGDPRGMAMVELLLHLPREIVDPLIVDYGKRHEVHLRKFA